MGDDRVQKYRVFFKGEIEGGKELQAVKEQLGQLFKTSPVRIEKLFTGAPVTLNRNLDSDAAQEYISALKNLGAICYSEPMTEATPDQVASLGAKTEKPASRVPVMSRGRILLTAAGMALLPFAYLYLILFIADATYTHIDDNTSLLEYDPFIIGLLAYSIPILIGVLLVAAMVKSVIAPFLQRRFSIPISKQKEPALFAYVEKLCRSAGSIMPSSIEVDCTAGTSIGYRKGFLGMMEDKLVLTIGLPLVTRMTLMELTSAVAHELGRAANRSNARIYYLVTSINTWLARVISEQDIVDQKIIGWIATGGFHIRLPLQIAQFFIWLSKKILLVFKLAGNYLNDAFSRAMEFDADDIAVRIAGTEAFISSLHANALLAAASNRAHQEITISKRPGDNSLPDNFIFFIAAILDQMNDDEKAQIGITTLAATGELSDHIATDRERVNRAKRARAKGLVQSDKAASTLFINFEEICKSSTGRYYREVLGLQPAKDTLVPVADFLNPTDLKIEAPKDEINKFDDI